MDTIFDFSGSSIYVPIESCFSRKFLLRSVCGVIMSGSALLSNALAQLPRTLFLWRQPIKPFQSRVLSSQTLFVCLHIRSRR